MSQIKATIFTLTILLLPRGDIDQRETLKRIDIEHNQGFAESSNIDVLVCQRGFISQFLSFLFDFLYLFSFVMAERI